MRTELLIAVDVDGGTCWDDDEHGGCYFNNTGVCALFLRPSLSDDVDPTRLRPCDWQPAVLAQHLGTSDVWDRCAECLGAAKQARHLRIKAEVIDKVLVEIAQERDDAESDLAGVMVLSDEAVAAELRGIGLDPVSVGERGRVLATTLLARRRRREAARKPMPTADRPLEERVRWLVERDRVNEARVLLDGADNEERAREGVQRWMKLLAPPVPRVVRSSEDDR